VQKRRRGPKWKVLSEEEHTICRRFALARKRTGLWQIEWAKALGLSHGALASIEGGRVALKWPVFRKMHELYAVNPHWLADGLGPWQFKLVLPAEVGRRAGPKALFSEVYANEVKPQVAEQIGQVLDQQTRAILTRLEAGPKAGTFRAVAGQSVLETLDLALVMAPDDAFREAVKGLLMLGHSLIAASKGETKEAVTGRLEELWALRQQTTALELRKRQGSG